MTAITKTAGSFGLSAWTAAALAAAPLAVVAAGVAITAATTTAVPVGAAVEAGPDQTITLPTNQVTLNGRINGVTARWVTRAGAERSTVASPTSPVTTVTFAQPGTYKFELMSFDARGKRVGRDSVKVFVQKAPVASANWRERILNTDGTINAAEYRYVANNINTDAIIDYRLGPKYANFNHAGEAPAPTAYAPDPTGYGLWPSGTKVESDPAEGAKCQRSETLPRSDQEELARGLRGAGWLVGGQHIFVPDNPSDPDYRMGISNTRGADGLVFDTGGLCMRMRASWEYDWWNRNGIAEPTNRQIRDLAAARPSLPPVPVAIARGRANASQMSFAAFKDGTIAPIFVGNTAPEFADITPVQLPAGMVPTAMAVTPQNEFLVVSIWDTNTVSGKLAFIAIRTRQMAVGNPSQTQNARWYFGTPGAWTVRGIKLLGMIDLPFAAPTSVDVSTNLTLGNPRGWSSNDNPARGDLSRQSARDFWASVSPIHPVGEEEWSQMASAGYAVVASRAENKVSFIDMGPLFQYYRKMYLTTQANYDRTVDVSTTDPTKWPFTFAVEPSQRPVIATTLAVDQPTGVSAGVQAKGYALDRSSYIFEYLQRSPREDWSGVEPERYMGRSRAFVASMDGTVRIFNVQGLNLPGSPVGKAVPATPLGSFKAGRNPSFAYVNSTGTAPEDLFLVSRGDRSITYAWPTGVVQGVLRDSRLIDPVGGAVSLNQGGYGGSGRGRAVWTTFVSITDYSGKSIHTFAVDPTRDLPRPSEELYSFNTPAGKSLWLFGSTVRTPGKPFMIDMEEII